VRFKVSKVRVLPIQERERLRRSENSKGPAGSACGEPPESPFSELNAALESLIFSLKKESPGIWFLL